MDNEKSILCKYGIKETKPNLLAVKMVTNMIKENRLETNYKIYLYNCEKILKLHRKIIKVDGFGSIYELNLYCRKNNYISEFEKAKKEEEER